MTGRDLILYILANHLEDELVFKDGTFVGFDTPASFAAKHHVGIATVNAWAQLGEISIMPIGDTYLIPTNALN